MSSLASQEQVDLARPFSFHNFQPDPSKIYRVVGDIPRELPVADGARFLFVSKDQRALTHGLHKYPAKFFPELPRWLIEKYSNPGDTVLDPFMGSATTNLEAMLSGRNSIGVDVDPFSRMLARVKTTPLAERPLHKAWATLRPLLEQYREPQGLQGVPEFPYREHWFQEFMLKELAYIKRRILDLEAPAAVKNFFLVIFSSTIRAVSEADNNCTRTVVRKKLDKKVFPGMAVKLFLRRTEQQVENMAAFSRLKPSGRVKILDGADARNIKGAPDDSVDCAVTSPPYANAVDYPRTHQLEMYWLGLANGSLRDLKEEHVGTEVVSAKEYARLHQVGCPDADGVIEKIFETDPRRAYIAAKYLEDMFANLREVRRVLKPGSPYVIVVGDNMMRGQQFETWKYLRNKAPEFGFKVECRFVSEIINHFIKVPRKERISCDHVLVLVK